MNPHPLITLILFGILAIVSGWALGTLCYGIKLVLEDIKRRHKKENEKIGESKE